MGYHRVVYTACRIYGWSDEELQKRWREIIEICPANIGCSAEDAISAMSGGWSEVKKKPYKIWLPDTTTLPDLSDDMLCKLRESLSNRGCVKVTSTANIIRKSLYNVLRKAPQACGQGTAAIRVADLQRACNNYGYNEARDWLSRNNILILRGGTYTPGWRSMTYFVNVPLIMYFAGFETEDLDWTSTKAA